MLITANRQSLSKAKFLIAHQLRSLVQDAAQLATQPSNSTQPKPSSVSKDAPLGRDPIFDAAVAFLTQSGLHTIDGLPLPRFMAARRGERPPPMSLAEAITRVKSARRTKFDQTIELAIKLGIDPRRGDQMVRGAAALPYGTGKTVRVAVFARGEAAAAARAAGADVVGDEELVSEIQSTGGSNIGVTFDKCIAHPDMMSALGRVARILGPRGLMPNPKLGTVTTNIEQAIASLKAGRVEFRADKGGVVHGGIGKCSFPDEHLMANARALVAALLSARPKGVKGSGANGYLLKAHLSSTMGPGIALVVPSLMAAQATRQQGVGERGGR